MDIMAARLTKNLVFIKENLSDIDIDNIVDVLIQKGVIRLTDRPTIFDRKPLKDKIQYVLNEVLRKKKYDEFICALLDTSNEHIVKEITSLDDEEFAQFTEAIQEMESTKDVTGAIFDAQHLNISLKSENDELTKKYEELKKTQQGLRLQLEEKHEMVKLLKSDLRISAREKDQIATERDKIASERDSLNCRVTQLENEIAGLRKDLDLKTDQMETMRSYLEEIKLELAKDRQDRRDERQQHDNELKERQTQFESIMKLLNETRGKQNQTQTKKPQGASYKTNIACNIKKASNRKSQNNMNN